MRKPVRIWQNMPFIADLPGEVLPGSTLVELLGQHRVLVEGHQGVTQYGHQTIRVKVKFGHICIVGRELKLAIMSKEQLVITGVIDCVSVQRRDE